MAETKDNETLPATCLRSGKTSNSDENSPISTVPTDREKPTANNHKDPEMDREAKRRKTSPCELINNPIRSSSFTFDTKYAATPDSTPKFGCFKLLESPAEVGKSPVLSPASEEEEDDGEDETPELSEREIREVLGSVDGIIRND